MPESTVLDISRCVEPDRVHKSVYTDQQIFDREMERIWERIWVYCGHESQVPNAGDYYAVTIGRQPMIMVRQRRRQRCRCCYNRCPHRGVQVVGNLQGQHRQRVRLLVPRVELPPRRQACARSRWPSGYEGTRMTRDNPDCSMKRAARVDSYRGFVFASLAADGPSLTRVPRRGQDRLRRHVRPLAARRGRGRADLPSRDAALELEVLHGEPARRAAPVGDAPVDRHLRRPGREAPQGARRARRRSTTTTCRPSRRASSSGTRVQTINFPHGHGILKAYMGLRPHDPDTLEYEALLKQAYGEAEDRGVPLAQHPPRAGLSVPVGAVAAAAAALPAPDRARQDDVGDLALPPEGRARGDLPAQPLVLQPGQLAGDDDQRRRPGELDQGPVGPAVERRRLGELPPLLRRRPRGERRRPTRTTARRKR